MRRGSPDLATGNRRAAAEPVAARLPRPRLVGHVRPPRSSTFAIVALGALATITLALTAPWASAQAAAGDRVYERVTPGFKNGGGTWGVGIGETDPVRSGTSVVPISEDGDRLAADEVVSFADDPGSVIREAWFLMERGEHAWHTSAVAPGPADFVPAGNSPRVSAASADLGRMTMESEYEIDARDADGQGNSDIYGYLAGQSDDDVQLLSCPPPPVICDEPVDAKQASASDFSHGINPMSADGTLALFESTESFDGAVSGSQIYASVGGDVRWISQPLETPLPAGATQVTSASSANNSSSFFATDASSSPLPEANAAGAVGAWRNAISEDGSRVFFGSPARGASTRVYVRIGDQRTLEVSRVRGGSGPSSKAKFRGASTDGDRALITTAQALLPAAGSDPAATDPNTVEDLYLWSHDPVGDPENDAQEALTRISGLTQVGPGPAIDGQVGLSAVGMSEDLTRVYLTTRTDVAAGDQSAANLYEARLPAADPRDGTVRHIATYFEDELPSSTSGVAGFSGCMNAYTVGGVTSAASHTCASASPGGRYLAFQSPEPLTTGDGDAREDVFLYDSADGSLERASAGDGGGRGNGDVDAHFEVNHQHNASITDAGEVFFSTDEGLVAADGNGKRDAYEYRAADGQVRLVSSGQATSDSIFVGASADGDDVFFLTLEDLADDNDGMGDFYVARRGGTFPDRRRGCALGADACQGAGSPPAVIAPRTGGETGGNVDRPRVRLGVRPLPRRARRRAARRGVLVLPVRTSAGGRVRAVARARVKPGKRKARVRRVGANGARARGAGVVRLRLRLSRAARVHLRSGRRLRLRVAVRMAGARPRTVAVVLVRRGR